MHQAASDWPSPPHPTPLCPASPSIPLHPSHPTAFQVRFSKASRRRHATSELVRTPRGAPLGGGVEGGALLSIPSGQPVWHAGMLRHDQVTRSRLLVSQQAERAGEGPCLSARWCAPSRPHRGARRDERTMPQSQLQMWAQEAGGQPRRAQEGKWRKGEPQAQSQDLRQEECRSQGARLATPWRVCSPPMGQCSGSGALDVGTFTKEKRSGRQGHGNQAPFHH